MIRTVLIDPRKTETAELADIHLALKPATDAILFNGLLTYLRQNDRLDFDFLERHTRGFSEALSAAKPFTIPLVSRLCELDEENIVRFFSLFARTEKTVTLYAQGIHQSTSGTDKINSIINCHLATGRIGRPGMGPFSLTGQGNAMGGREVGGMSTQLAAHIGFDSPTNISIVQEFWRSPTIATRPGLKAVEMFNSIREGAIKALWIIATNPMVSLPDAASVREALTGCELLIISECTRKTDTTAFAHVLLPAAAWGEKDGTVTNSERRISRQRAFLPCPGEAKPDWWILCEVAKRMGFQDAFTFRGPAAIFREHARLSGFRNQGTRDFDISGLEALTDQEYAEMNPVQWPVRSKGSKGTARMFVDGRFFTADAKARLVPILPRPPACLPVARFPFILNTGRIRDQWHTMSRTGDSARLSRHIPEPFAELSSRDAKQLAISEGDIVRISSPLGELLARARIGDTQKPGNVFVPFHWNGQFAKQANVNALVPSSTDPLSGQPEYKQTPVMIRKAEFAFFGFAISRSPLKLSDASYWVRIQATGCTRHEFAYKDPIPDWPTWAKELLGVADRDPTWIEYWDSARKHYRGACLLQSRIESCIYLAAEPALPERAWLESLFSKENLTMTDRSGVLYGQPC